ncbi:hypothetical protein D9M73_65160 [compost metagenome]
MDDEVMFARSAPGEKTEVRFMLPTPLAQALDALAFADDNKGRPELIERVLKEFAEKEIHKSMIRVRMLRGNPMLTERSGEQPERSA